MKVINNINLKPVNINSLDTKREFLIINEKFKTIFFKFEVGEGLPNHSHNGYATLQVISGIVDIEFETGEKFSLNEGDFLPFDARVMHNVIAKEKAKMLVTISQVLEEK